MHIGIIFFFMQNLPNSVVACPSRFNRLYSPMVRKAVFDSYIFGSHSIPRLICCPAILADTENIILWQVLVP